MVFYLCRQTWVQVQLLCFCIWCLCCLCCTHSKALSCHIPVREVFCKTLMSGQVMSCHVMSCHVMSCRVVSCHVMSQLPVTPVDTAALWRALSTGVALLQHASLAPSLPLSSPSHKAVFTHLLKRPCLNLPPSKYFLPHGSQPCQVASAPPTMAFPFPPLGSYIMLS